MDQHEVVLKADPHRPVVRVQWVLAKLGVGLGRLTRLALSPEEGEKRQEALSS